jgi:hypothetical protein
MEDFRAVDLEILALQTFFRPNLIYVSKATFWMVLCFGRLRLAIEKHSSLYARSISDKEKSFKTIGNLQQFITFSLHQWH